MTDEVNTDGSINRNEEELGSRHHSNYKSAISRTHIGAEDCGKYSNPVEFSWRQFWQSFLYENLWERTSSRHESLRDMGLRGH